MKTEIKLSNQRRSFYEKKEKKILQKQNNRYKN